jgi:hypothetical protein
MPRTRTEWATFSASRTEAARLWNDLVLRHHRIRCLGWKWPSKLRWERWARGRYPGLSAQSSQQLIGEFCEAVNSCRTLRKNRQTQARYPWRLRRYHDVVYTNQDARIRDGRLLLPHGQSGTLRLRIPNTLTLPGRLMEVRLSYGRARLICAVADAARAQQIVIGVDLGVNTLIAATDGQKVILISGRAAKATIEYRNKNSWPESSKRSRHARSIRGATSGCNAASTNCSTKRSGASATCATRQHAKWSKPFPTRCATSASRSTLPPSASGVSTPSR